MESNIEVNESDVFDIKTEDFVEVPENIISELLQLYYKNHRMIKNIKYSSKIVVADLIPRVIEYSHAKPDYFTASQMTEVVSQLGYVLGGMLFKDISVTELKETEFDKYIKSIVNLNCYFTSIECKFDKLLKNNKKQSIKMNVIRMLRLRSIVFIEMEANIKSSFNSKVRFFSKLYKEEMRN